MFPRVLLAHADVALRRQAAVALIGPRQVGKTTLAFELMRGRPSIYLDMERPSDLAKLSDPEAFLLIHQDKLVVIDEIHRTPGLFAVLRGLIDRGRREGRGVGRFLLLGSASIDLLKQSSESLAGRITFLELSGLQLSEVASAGVAAQQLWVRGGFPDSVRALSDGESLAWRNDFLRTYLERDIPLLGPRVPVETMRRLWTMLAHSQSTLLHASELAQSLGVSAPTISRYVDLLADLLLVRRLPPHHTNSMKRLVKSPKVYVRDSGLVHALLGIGSLDALLGHPVAGKSWEGFVVEQLIAAAPVHTKATFYRTQAGAEVDLLLTLPDGALWAFEIKLSSAPKLERGFHEARRDLQPARSLVIVGGAESFPLADGVSAMGVAQAAAELRAFGQLSHE